MQLHVSAIVLHEVEKNVRKKLGEIYLERFFRLVQQLSVIETLPSRQAITRAERVIAAKDAVILAEFKRSRCTHLITLDKHDFLQDKVVEFVHPKKIWTPKMYFESA